MWLRSSLVFVLIHHGHGALTCQSLGVGYRPAPSTRPVSGPQGLLFPFPTGPVTVPVYRNKEIEAQRVAKAKKWCCDSSITETVVGAEGLRGQEGKGYDYGKPG